jgi:ubiquinone/menaquinone biosynthesis C-methylase UbiE
MPDDMQDHYDRLAASYDENWAYSPEFISWMTGHIVERLRIHSGDRVLDLGCGTGLYSRGLAEHADQVLCIDPSANMLNRLPTDETLVPVRASAEDVVSGAVPLPFYRLDAVLVKESIHHVRDHAVVLRRLADMLAPGGRLLVVMLPTRVEYPLFTEALELFGRLQPDPDDIADSMSAAGLAVDLRYESFRLSLEKRRYIRMVRSRYMSLLSSFDDEELERGIVEISESHPDELMEFADRHAFVLGIRG